MLGVGLLVFNRIATPSKPGYALAVASATPAVVNIQTTKITRVSPLCQIPMYRRLCDAYPGNTPLQNSLGSGVIVRSDGYILTNHHVVAEADAIQVMFANNQRTTAQVIGSDRHTDLALIKVEATGLPVIPYDPDEQVRVGDIALAIGNPFGLGHSVSLGIVSAVSRAFITDSPYDDFLQTDAAISPGNSGGALIDHDGRLLGINSMIYSQSGGSDGIGFAIPAALALQVMDQILESGRVVRGWLGVSLGPHQTQGIQVTGLSPGGPAHVAGIRIRDIVISVGGLPAGNTQAIIDLISATSPGQTIQIEIQRNGERFVASVEVSELR